ncbi:hypothetical protein BAT02nite_37180 [Bacillus atrophaeus]|nr:hypothetical protein BAT02nite_37180 [Bacillus atrophaeus]
MKAYFHYILYFHFLFFSSNSIADVKAITKKPSSFSSLAISSENNNKLNRISLNAIAYNDRVELRWGAGTSKLWLNPWKNI